MYSCSKDCLTRFGLLLTYQRGEQTAQNYSNLISSENLNNIKAISSDSERWVLSALAHIAGMAGECNESRKFSILHLYNWIELFFLMRLNFNFQFQFKNN